ncbi:hypothetical protein LC040_12220 [Bacillus tianshenii]|nr:hypothetical protein LC040_12220 [Bacillus tianshenii]
MDLKLSITLNMPLYVQGKNLRKVLPASLWDKIRYEIYRRNNNECMVCGYKEKLQAHEEWKINKESRVLILKNIKCLCYNCHSIKHFNHSALRSNSEERIKELISHFMKVNECTKEDYRAHVKELNEKNPRNPLYYKGRNPLEMIEKVKHLDAEESALKKEHWTFQLYPDLPYYEDICQFLKKKNLLAIN